MAIARRHAHVDAMTPTLRVVALLSLVLCIQAQQVADHELILKDSDSVTVEAVQGVMKSLGFTDQQANGILEQISSNGEATGAFGSKTGLEKAAAEFTKVGLKTEIRPRKIGEYGEGSDVTEITSAKQLEELLNGGKPMLLKLYGTSCKACHAMVGDYKAAATKLKGKLLFAAFNLQAIPKEEATAIAQALRVQVIPTIRFSSGTGDFLEFGGNDRSEAALVRFAEKAVAALPTAEATPEGGEDAGASAATEAPAAAEAPLGDEAAPAARSDARTAEGQPAVAADAGEATAEKPAPKESKIGMSKVGQAPSPQPAAVGAEPAAAAA